MTRIAYALILAALLVGCGKSNSNSVSAANLLPEVPKDGFPKLGTQDLEKGTGPAATPGDLLLVWYTGKLTDGTVFDGNMEEKTYKPISGKDLLSFQLGAGQMIQAFDEGLKGAKEGMVRKLNVPWAMGYGAEGNGKNIPAKADLIFVVKVVKVYKAGVEQFIEWKDIKKGTGAEAKKDSDIVIKYTGKLLTTRVFDEQKKLEVNVSKLIPGFNKCIIGMKVGGKRKITWPPGSPNPTGGIPANQPAEYEVELLAVKK